MNNEITYLKCEFCDTVYEESDSCPKCAEEWKKLMTCDYCHKEFSLNNEAFDTEYLKYSIEVQSGMWQDWDRINRIGRFCSIECLAKWVLDHFKIKQ
jgi:uncharacterized protein YozE (UPF0346 family)